MPRSATPTMPTGLAVDPPASKELRLFGLGGWTIDRFIARRTRLHELQYAATRLRERPVAVEPAPGELPPTFCVFWSMASAAADGRISPRRGGDLRAERGRRLDDRVRRIQLGAGWSVGAGRGGAAAWGRDASAPARCPSAIGRRKGSRRTKFGCAT